MKRLTKYSVAKSLLVIINTAFYLSILTVILLIPTLFQNSDFLVIRLEQIVLFTMISLMIWHMRVLAKAFKENLFYEKRIVKVLNYLSLLLIAYVFLDYGFYLIKNYGKDLICSGSVLVDLIVYYIKPINFSLLFLSAISFLLSFVANEGFELKEENRLTV